MKNHPNAKSYPVTPLFDDVALSPTQKVFVQMAEITLSLGVYRDEMTTTAIREDFLLNEHGEWYTPPTNPSRPCVVFFEKGVDGTTVAEKLNLLGEQWASGEPCQHEPTLVINADDGSTIAVFDLTNDGYYQSDDEKAVLVDVLGKTVIGGVLYVMFGNKELECLYLDGVLPPLDPVSYHYDKQTVTRYILDALKPNAFYRDMVQEHLAEFLPETL